MSEILEFQAGREAFLAEKPRDGRRNEHWLRGWDQEQCDALREIHDALVKRMESRG